MSSKIINIASIYIIIGGMYTMTNCFPIGSVISRILYWLYIIISLFYFVKANLKYKLPVFFKALNVLLLLFVVYGILLFFDNSAFILYTGESVSKQAYLRSILMSLLPIYTFYFFSREHLIDDQFIRLFIPLFIFFAINSYLFLQHERMEQIEMMVNKIDGFTNNHGYTLLSIVPLLVFCRRNIIKFIYLLILAVFIVLSMKRGAIVILLLCFIYFFKESIRFSTKKQKFYITILSLIMLIGGISFLSDYLVDNQYFQRRIEDTINGNTSGRDVLSSRLLQVFSSEPSLVKIIFGHGANYTLRAVGQYAHNDWIEILVNQGLFGVIIYLYYWLSLFKKWKSSRDNSLVHAALGLFILIYLPKTIFSMSYNDMTMYSTLVLGYCISQQSPVSSNKY